MRVLSWIFYFFAGIYALEFLNELTQDSWAGQTVGDFWQYMPIVLLLGGLGYGCRWLSQRKKKEGVLREL